LFPQGGNLSEIVEALEKDSHSDWAFWVFDECRMRGLYPKETACGYRNSGHWNSGDGNSGYWNSGYRNSGNGNSGNWNSGDGNSGYWNSGYRNSGYWNSGDWNSGDRNSGYWNSGDGNSGFFNSQTPENIYVFNKPCPRKVWESAKIPAFLYFSTGKWIKSEEMTEEEKESHPHHGVTGGYLRTIAYKDAFQAAWEAASEEEKDQLKQLPNFDAEVFFEISGIRVE